jgi:histidinol-phosphatase (PHP family)
MEREEWKVSLHGGHSSAYCDHAGDDLRAILDAAVAFGYHTFGVTEHAPRLGEEFLFPEEREMGWDLAKVEANFEAYCRDITPLAEEYGDRLVVLRGFETEAVPPATYRDVMIAFRNRPCFDYMVGSIHHVNECLIDYTREEFENAMAEAGGLEALAVAYFEAVGEMIEEIQPEVVGHIDLIRKNGHFYGTLDTPPIVEAAMGALEVVRDCAAILDCNTAGYRKGLRSPYPEPWIVQAANEMGIPFCFGDDSHSVADVGAGLEEGRAYLLENGVQTITILTKEGGALVKKVVALEA